MPWMVKTYRKRGGKPKRFGMSTLFSEREIQNLAADPDGCYKIINTTSRRVSSVGGACRRPTPPNLWGSRRGFRDGEPAAAAPAASKPAAPAPAPAAKPVAGFWPFSKKKPKQLPRDPRKMAQTVMYARGRDGSLIPLRGARRKRRRR